MVERITAYTTADGRIFRDRWGAIHFETQVKLTQFLKDSGLNEAQVNLLISSASDLAMILEPLAKEIRKDMKDRGS